MTVGETLTEARGQAGLSVDELSERTKIRGTVIRSIEQDDYDACGGDLYVRGYVRAIAGAVGIDAQPLIREFDLGRVSESSAASADSTRFDLPTVREDPAATRFDLPPVTDDLVAEGYDLPTPAGPDPAGASTSILPVVSQEPPGTARPPAGDWRNRRTVAATVVVAVVLVAAGIIGLRLVSGATATHDTAAATVPQSSAAARASAAAHASAAAQASAAAHASAAASASAAAQASQSSSQAAAQRAAAQSVTTLAVASAAAFGPDGFADGDNPGSASAAIARDPAAPWSTQWYATPQFGLLKHGTGLLLSLGNEVTVTSVSLDLSQYGGASLQLRAGNGTALPDLPVAATAANAGGALKLTLHRPVTAKYLLIWITVLPPDGAGHYQESVSHVVVSGHH